MFAVVLVGQGRVGNHRRGGGAGRRARSPRRDHGALLVDLAGDAPAVLGLPEPDGPGSRRLVRRRADRCRPTASTGSRSRSRAGLSARATRARRRSARVDRAEVLAGMLAAERRSVVVDAGVPAWAERRGPTRPAAGAGRGGGHEPARHPAVLPVAASGRRRARCSPRAWCSWSSRVGRSIATTSSRSSACRWWPRCWSTRRWPGRSTPGCSSAGCPARSSGRWVGRRDDARTAGRASSAGSTSRCVHRVEPFEPGDRAEAARQVGVAGAARLAAARRAGRPGGRPRRCWPGRSASVRSSRCSPIRAVTDVMVNGGGRVWVDRDGELAATDLVLSEPTVLHLVERIVAPLGLHVDRSSPGRRRPPARRLAGPRRRAAAGRRRAVPDHPPVRDPPGARSTRSRRPGVAALLALGGAGPQQHRGERRGRRRQDHAAQRPGGQHPRPASG